MAVAPKLLSCSRAAKYLGLHRNTLRRLVLAGAGPARVRGFKRYYFTRDGLNDWIESREAPVPQMLPRAANG